MDKTCEYCGEKFTFDPIRNNMKNINRHFESCKKKNSFKFNKNMKDSFFGYFELKKLLFLLEF
jgi:hypothetical protein